jgi:hypothetical protein
VWCKKRLQGLKKNSTDHFGDWGVFIARKNFKTLLHAEFSCAILAKDW